MPGPLGSSVHVDKLLTDISIGYVQDQKRFIADKVSPIYKVEKSSDKYPTWAAADFLRMQTVKTSRYSPAPEATFTMSTGLYSCEEWPLKKLITDKDRTDADVDIDEATTKFLTQQILLRRDHEVVSKLFTAANWDTTYTGAASAADFVHFRDASSVPFQTIRTYSRVCQIQAGGFYPNTVVVGGLVDDYLKEHDDTLDKIKYTQEGIASNELLARAFGVEQYLVADSVRNTAQAGDAASMANMGGNFLWLGYVAPEASRYNPSAMYTFSWKDYDATGEGGALISRWTNDDPVGEWLKAEAAFDAKVTSSASGILLINAG